MGIGKKREARFHLASWTSLNPIGFDPCGAIFGAIRRPYYAQARFFADETLGSNRIYWYFAEPTAVIYDQPTRFCPGIDFVAQNPPVQFERTGPNRSIRKYTHVPLHPVYPGAHWHGTSDDFYGKTKVGTLPAVLICNEFHGDEAIIYGGLALASKFSYTPPTPPTIKGGIALGGKVQEGGGILHSGIGLAGKVKVPTIEISGGLALSGQLSVPSLEYFFGIALGGRTTIGGLSDRVLMGGLALSGKATIGGLSDRILKGGLALAGKATVPGVSPPTLNGGLALAGKATVPGVSPPTLKGGIAMGSTIVEGGGGGGGGSGATCTLAINLGTITNDTFTSTVTAGQILWYRWPVTNGSSWHVTCTATTGSLPSMVVFTGPDCSHQTNRGTIFGSGFSVTWTEAANEFAWMFVEGNLIGAGTATLHITTP